jgi:hypothetical protein
MRDKPLQRAQAARYRSSLDEGLQEDSNARRTSAAPLFHRETGPARRKIPVDRFAIVDVDSATGRQSRIAFKNGKSPTMPMNKPHLEFHKVDMKQGWATPSGYPAGIQQKILASDLDETRKMGSRTRLLRFAPGVYTTAPFVHDHWEEVYLVSGDLIVGNDAQGRGGELFEAPTYACRPPGVHHGPFKSDHGCLLYEIHYYDESKK